MGDHSIQPLIAMSAANRKGSWLSMHNAVSNMKKIQIKRLSGSKSNALSFVYTLGASAHGMGVQAKDVIGAHTCLCMVRAPGPDLAFPYYFRVRGQFTGPFKKRKNKSVCRPSHVKGPSGNP